MPHERSLGVTVVVTNYNHGAYLESAVTSVLNQTHKPQRIIIIDDGSTDDSEKVLAALPKRVEVFRQENQGVVAARNRALSMVDTSYVAFLDADDYMLPMFLRWHLAAWRLPHRRQALTYSPFRNVGPDGSSGYQHSAPWSRARLAHMNYIANTALFLRRALDEVSGYSDRYAPIGHEDWDLLLKLADHGWHGRMVPRPLFTTRTVRGSRNEQSLSARWVVDEAIHDDHPWTVTPGTPTRLEQLHQKATNPMQTALRRWDREHT
jgi:glycosyltransferase involved in cell wall biosynthesis